mgnify:CR=1 FL=1
MKKIILMVTAVMAVTFSQAQDITDAVRYSSEELSGTARYRAMSGAFGALGGDLSSITINPAGSAVFTTSYSTLTLNYNRRDSDASYFNNLNSNRNSGFDLDQAGAVLLFNSTNPENRFNKFTLGFNYSQTSNFDDNFLARGRSNNSIDSYFLGYAEGIPLELLETVENESVNDLYRYLGENEGFGAQQALLGYQGFIINPDSNTLENTSYNSAVGAGSFDQQYSYASTGLNGKFAFNVATEFNNRLYFGLNLNAHFMNFDRSTRLIENNSNAGSETNEILFQNNLSTTGNGFSFQAGTIAKLGEIVRVGVAYESPTWLTVQEQTTQRLDTYSIEFDESISVSPDIVNIYPDYKLKTPGKLTGSLALILGTQGLISFDYSYKDYSNTEFRPTNDPEFMFFNDQLSENLQAVSAIRVGGEYRIDNFSLRGGYRIEQSPYKDEVTIGELNGYSAGLGYNFGNIKLDLAYDNASRTDNPQLYQVGLINTVGIDRDISSVILSLSFGI